VILQALILPLPPPIPEPITASLCRIIACMPEETLLSFEQARALVEKHAATLPTPPDESVGLGQSAGRVLAETIAADRDFPPFPRATRDGFAVRAADLATLPARLRVVGEIKAGAGIEAASLRVGAGEACAIMTGAPAPAGSDAVVMVEYTAQAAGMVEISRAVAAGENIVPAGAEARQSSVLLTPGTRLDHAAIAVAASVGRLRLQVYRQPRVAVLATGDEIVDIAATPGTFQIRNSNSHSLAAQVQRAGGGPVMLPVAPDEKSRLRELVAAGLQSDLLLLSGGVSVGRYDLVEQVLAELRAEFFFTGARIQPGKPIVFGRCQSKYFFGLPGNPVSTMVTFELFARPMLDALSGAAPGKLRLLHARLQAPVRTKTGLTRFLPGLLTGEFAQTEVQLLPWQGSGDLAASVRANCYVVIPPDRELVPGGEWVAILPR
jgi:molybdopterin molybdotransferase